MAEQAASSVASAVTGELTGIVLSGLIEKFGQQAASGQKLQRLEMLVIKIHSAVEASEKHNIENSWLVQWREKLKEAASQGDEVLAVFKQRAEDAQATNSANQRQGASSASSSAAGALSFTRNYLSGMVQVIHDAGKMLFSSDNEVEKLNVAVERLEKLSPDIGEFIRLLRLEISPELEQSQPTKRKRPSPPDQVEEMMRVSTGDKVEEEIRSEIYGTPRRPVEAWVAETAEYKEFRVRSALLHKLTEALEEIRWASWNAEERELEGSGRVVQWAAVLQEALRRGQAAHMDMGDRLCRGRGSEELGRDHLTVEQLFGLVRSLEMLAGEVESFVSLVELCPLAPLPPGQDEIWARCWPRRQQ